MKRLPPKHLKELAVLCGGLILVAGMTLPATPASAAVPLSIPFTFQYTAIGYGTYSFTMSSGNTNSNANGACTITSISPSTITLGGSATISWSCGGTDYYVVIGPYIAASAGADPGYCPGPNIPISSSCSNGSGSCTITGSASVTPTQAETYTYSPYAILADYSNHPGWNADGCASSDVISWASPGPSQTLTVTASNPCPTAAWEPWSNIFVIDPGQTADINNAGYNFCVTNSGGNYVVVGGSSGGELQSFINYAGNVGASTFSP